MKKLIAIICFSIFAMGSANSGIIAGISGNIGMLDAKGTESVDGGNSTADKTEDLEIGFMSVFAEATLGDNVRVGLSYVPYALESETSENTRNDNCTHDGASGCTSTSNKVQVDVEDMASFYLSYYIDNFFFKAGVTSADVVTNESLATGSKYGDASLDGYFVGAGFDAELDSGLFVRSEIALTQYSDIQLDSTGSDNSNQINVTNLDGMTASVSVGKAF